MSVKNLRLAILEEYKNMAAFCEESGIPRATLDNIMKERSEPSRQTIQAIYNALHTATVEKKYSIFFT